MIDFEILVITRGRVGNQKTLSNFAPGLRRNIILVCHCGEAAQHARTWGDQVKDIVEYPVTCNHVGKVRGWCIDRFPAQVLIFVDDNVQLYKRLDGYRKHSTLRALSTKNFEPDAVEFGQANLFGEMIADLLNGYGAVGISQRAFNFEYGELPHVENVRRTFAVWGINVEHYRRCGVRFEDWEIREDFAVQLGISLIGVPTKVNYEYAFDKSANQPGGCSTYRTLEMSNRNAERLQQTFGAQFVNIVDKKTKTWGGEFGEAGIAKEVKIKLLDAYNYGKENKT